MSGATGGTLDWKFLLRFHTHDKNVDPVKVRMNPTGE
jgi:hypothetical protein